MSEPVIRGVEFSTSWTTAYPSLLEAARGRLVTRAGYMGTRAAARGDMCLPWESYEEGHWSRFWAYYLAAPGSLRTGRVSSDAAWDRVVPLQWLHGATVTAPSGVVADARVYLYPAAISVVIRATASGAWPLGELAAEVAGIRNSREWGLSGATSASTGRNLVGIAEDLRAQAQAFLADPAPAETVPPVALTVAAPAAGDGPAAAFGLGNHDAASCLAGLAALGPPGELLDDHLLDANSDSRLGGRVYAVPSGHAIWNPAVFLRGADPADSQKSHPLACLVANHTDLVTHVAALGGIASWADKRPQIPVAVAELVKRAVLRLSQLHEGDPIKTYRSGIARVRIEPLAPALERLRRLI